MKDLDKNKSHSSVAQSSGILLVHCKLYEIVNKLLDPTTKLAVSYVEITQNGRIGHG